MPPPQILGACNRTAIPGLDLEYEVRPRRVHQLQNRLGFWIAHGFCLLRLPQCYRFEEAADAGRKRRLRLKNPAPPPSAAEVRDRLAVRKAAACRSARANMNTPPSLNTTD